MNTFNITIGPDCEDIIMDYVYQLEHVEKWEKVNKEIRGFNYHVFKERSWVNGWRRYTDNLQKIRASIDRGCS